MPEKNSLAIEKGLSASIPKFALQANPGKLNCGPGKISQVTSPVKLLSGSERSQTPASKTLTVISPSVPVSEMERSRAALITRVCFVLQDLSSRSGDESQTST
ncbi:hypothetical protein SRHO_G00248460 [Serrasalmus rhombeus]